MDISVLKVTVWHHNACQVILNSYTRNRLVNPNLVFIFFFLQLLVLMLQLNNCNLENSETIHFDNHIDFDVVTSTQSHTYSTVSETFISFVFTFKQKKD